MGEVSRQLLAHIREVGGGRYIDQTLKEHCSKTAEYAAADLKQVGLYHVGYTAGILHDLGKATELYQDYLKKAAKGIAVNRGSVNHTFAGVIWLWEKYHRKEATDIEKITCEIIAYGMGSHHGLFDVVSEKGIDGFEHRLVENREELHYQEAIDKFFSVCVSEETVDADFKQAVKEVTAFFTCTKKYCHNPKEGTFAFGMLARLIASAVMDGDRRDTGEFMADIQYPALNPIEDNIWSKQLQFMEASLAGMSEKYSEDRLKDMKKDSSLSGQVRLNEARGKISNQCKAFAQNPGGIYRLSVPTGGGKTLSMLRYALAHAEIHGKERIFYFAPLLSILDQNAEVIRSNIQDKDLVLEHHSNVIRVRETDEALDQYEVLTECWKQCMVVSTMVQFLNTLFEAKTTSVRRMNALCNSVIILDEVQSLPTNMSYMINGALNFLAQYCRATIILCSATQPCFQELKYPLRLSEPEHMVPFEKDLWSVFKRTEVMDYCIPSGYTIEDLADMIGQMIQDRKSLFIICNTKEEVLDLYKSLQLEENCKKFHLSTSMCMRHRQDVLAQIEKVPAYEKKILVSTQLIESGVDISFEGGIRILAGIDNITQSAGRCNRNNELDSLGSVRIVNIQNEKLSRLSDIQEAQNAAQELLYHYKKDPRMFQEDILSDDSVAFYYSKLFAAPNRVKRFGFPVDSHTNIYTMLSDNHDFTCFNFDSRKRQTKALLLRQAFKTAGKAFHVFDHGTTDIIVPYGQGKEIIKALNSDRAMKDWKYLKQCLEDAKPYTISVFEYQLKALYDNGGINPNSDKPFITLEDGFYNDTFGLDIQGGGVEHDPIV